MPLFRWSTQESRYEIFGFFLLSFPQNERKIYYFFSVSLAQFVYFLEGSMFTFQLLDDEIHNYVFFIILSFKY